MDFGDLPQRGLILLGCGKMGGAMLEGWLTRGLPPSCVHVIDPNAPMWAAARGVHVNGVLPKDPSIVIIAVKPQMMGDALPAIKAYGNGETVLLSIAAGTKISAFEEAFGAKTPVVRAMPNTPAAIGQGITAYCRNAHVSDARLELSRALLSAVGKTVALESEDQIDAVTGVSGSGPAYVFHMIEALAAAGVEQGLSDEMAMELAVATVAGAGALAASSDESATQLRINVTSPNGTTQAALEVLMDPETGFPSLMKRAVAAAADRSRELGV
ncbi:pyrroline-5-carboxylate reductase [Boseongicola aestuarii]|jgi:pyrroline-5-carboxylate reductase|uniref:Pyrroline-5-carboxylate reductase n=1 Tax=Boseongicola aestuarii TaxID=1470561 RepID=A0A238J3Q7_9RHOB|nr:pyrroline-5-carboxylate reductase [Boseongicola aestuarii]SMX24600.1 Pyrroline-5-carboxylate reductase [Boseongicola aestuarii]